LSFSGSSWKLSGSSWNLSSLNFSPLLLDSKELKRAQKELKTTNYFFRGRTIPAIKPAFVSAVDVSLLLRLRSGDFGDLTNSRLEEIELCQLRRERTDNGGCNHLNPRREIPGKLTSMSG
jgi:hypothetical protein